MLGASALAVRSPDDQVTLGELKRWRERGAL
jgi:hypothetical protein